ncbi:MAG: hypothetical protein OFPII_34900 [Osedax symbiont Rs1]|nr:MAG: hypothetical protein OFPII_34900 [Osedax symbiont Rs1]
MDKLLILLSAVMIASLSVSTAAEGVKSNRASGLIGSPIVNGSSGCDDPLNPAIGCDSPLVNHYKKPSKKLIRKEFVVEKKAASGGSVHHIRDSTGRLVTDKPSGVSRDILIRSHSKIQTSAERVRANNN